MSDKLQQRLERLEDKSPERLRLEAKVKVGELTDKLDTVIVTDQDRQMAKESKTSGWSIKKTVALVVLLAVIGAVIFPAIGAGYWMFMATLSVYAYMGLIGLAVTAGAAAAAWAIYTLVRG